MTFFLPASSVRDRTLEVRDGDRTSRPAFVTNKGIKFGHFEEEEVGVPLSHPLTYAL